ncbi:hypothetical protein BS47DRAFT_1481999 [Hydnum rufescens UP504]|uniref:Uncharacterized protein n=1 Tax=Hydnum rufescens UP504 TaxID=1448309 RepID=A0A9P6E229_9AGAM|nr:hypothetical protein BS47DRAFT_1481999 [Hydnum rufescens UP504]
MLLNYHYGAAAIKRWEHQLEVFQNYPNPARPPVPVPASMGPKRTNNDRTVSIFKRQAARYANEAGPSGVAGDQPEEIMESEDQKRWTEDDVMLFLWANSPVAKERRHREVEEHNWHMEWRRGVITSN